MTASDRQHGGDHYAKMPTDMQPWNVLKHWLTPEEYRGWQKGVAIVYLARERDKGGDLDIQKAIHHLERLAEEFTDADKQLGLPLAEPDPVEDIRPDAIIVKRPWYPDDRPGWVEFNVCTDEPVPRLAKVEVLTRREREQREYRKVLNSAGSFFWADVVAYRIID